MEAATFADQLVVALWGWPGVLLILLGAWHLAERRFHWKPMLSGLVKTAAAAVATAAALISAWQGVSLAEADAALRAEDEWRRKVPPMSITSPEARLEAEERARLLRRDLTRDAHR